MLQQVTDHSNDTDYTECSSATISKTCYCTGEKKNEGCIDTNHKFKVWQKCEKFNVLAVGVEYNTSAIIRMIK